MKSNRRTFAFCVVVPILALTACSGQDPKPSADASYSSTTGNTTFDGEWVFTKPKGLIPQEFIICVAGCPTLLGKQANFAKDVDSLTVTADRVIADPALMSIPCSGGGGMSHEFKLELVSEGPDRLVASDVRLPGGGCDGMGPPRVSFVAERR